MVAQPLFCTAAQVEKEREMAEISATPLVRKLGIKAGQRIAFVNAPIDFARTLGPLPPGCDVVGSVSDEGERIDVILCFGGNQAALGEAFMHSKGQLTASGGLWLCWPKKASKVSTDLSDAVVQRIGLDGGLVDNKVCSVDATWSAMRFVYRLRDRPAQ
jgi:hypothetical protein